MEPSDPRVSVECLGLARCLRSFARYALAMGQVNAPHLSQCSLQNGQPSTFARELAGAGGQPGVESYPPDGVVWTEGAVVVWTAGEVVWVEAAVDPVVAAVDPAAVPLVPAAGRAGSVTSM